ncbi:hypothetical protein K7432_017254 [Basidiobolus ranarum]|uniref:HMA domain-containing protein n=1 Tax=Basidiobolus ranarum TaxID=34480 RepID=A0ABR2WDL9_9FUNG
MSANTDLQGVLVSQPEQNFLYRAIMQIEGMTCSSCVKTTEKALAAIDSIVTDSISVSSLTGRGVADFAIDDRVQLGKTIEKSISNIGYDLYP